MSLARLVRKGMSFTLLLGIAPGVVAAGEELFLERLPVVLSASRLSQTKRWDDTGAVDFPAPARRPGPVAARRGHA